MGIVVLLYSKDLGERKKQNKTKKKNELMEYFFGIDTQWGMIVFHAHAKLDQIEASSGNRISSMVDFGQIRAFMASKKLKELNVMSF